MAAKQAVCPKTLFCSKGAELSLWQPGLLPKRGMDNFEMYEYHVLTSAKGCKNICPTSRSGEK